jgi:hypothetical protein
MVPEPDQKSDDPYPLDLESANVNQPTGDNFRRWVRYSHQILAAMASDAEIPPLRITAVLTDDFSGAVNEALSANGQDEYTAERLGGTAIAKTIPITDDHGEVRVIFDSTIWRPGASSNSELLGLFLAAHEFTHAFIGRLRAVSGAMNGVILPSRTPVEVARSIARISVEEFVADIVAGRILATAGSATVDGETRPVRPADLYGFANGYSDQLGMVLDQTVYPGWPNLVQSYREHQIDLGTMWSRIGQGTDQALTLIAHAEAEAILNEGVQPLDETYSAQRGAALYLAPAWMTIRQEMGDSLFPTPGEFKAVEERTTHAGEEALLAMWGRLGLTFEIQPDRGFSIWVTEPQR